MWLPECQLAVGHGNSHRWNLFELEEGKRITEDGGNLCFWKSNFFYNGGVDFFVLFCGLSFYFPCWEWWSDFWCINLRFATVAYHLQSCVLRTPMYYLAKWAKKDLIDDIISPRMHWELHLLGFPCGVGRQDACLVSLIQESHNLLTLYLLEWVENLGVQRRGHSTLVK